MESRSKRKLSAALYRWFKEHKRDLPFRRDRTAYTIWISEVMLQQTRAAAVIDKYVQFIKNFSDVKSLAESPLEEILENWRGLGYYSRARNLHRGAIQIVKEYNGVFPDDYDEARKISGVGEYTAAAVLSLAYEIPVAVYDGNVRRVLSRVYYPETGAAKEEDLKRIAHELMEDLKGESPSVHNEALMELGAMICTPGNPDCRNCPTVKNCGVYQTGGIELAVSLPPAKKKPEKIPVDLDLFFITDPNKTGVILARDKHSPFLKNHWFFPHRVRVTTDRPVPERLNYQTPFLDQIVDGPRPGKVFEETDVPSSVMKGLRIKKMHTIQRTFRHTITHHKITGYVHICIMDPGPGINEEDSYFKVVELEDLERYVVSSMATKAMKLVAGET